MVITAKKIVNVLDAILDTAIFVVGLLILLISVYSMLDNLWQYQGALDDSLLRYRPSLDERILDGQFISEDQVAWLYIENTTIDYPVMQGVDNFDYLNKNPYGEFKLCGSIFLDYRNSRDFSDPYALVYGHHMERGVMFGALDYFRDENYFNAHTTGKLATAEGAFNLTVFAVASADAMDRVLFYPKGRTSAEITAYLQEKAFIYYPPEEGLQILALSTCLGDTLNDRLLVFATMQPR